MAFLSPTFLLAVVVLTYLSSFIFLALLRVTTGISIQRLGYLSLRRIAYTPREGIKLEVRRLGLRLHRPTFAQPTWVSLEFQDPQVTISLQEVGREQVGNDTEGENGSLGDVDGPYDARGPNAPPVEKRRRRVSLEPRRSRMWEKMTNVKEKVKRLHRKVKWLRMLDIVATNASCVITDVGCLQIANFTMAVDTRRKTVDRSRLFHYKKSPTSNQRPAEWMVTVRNILFTPEGKPPLEVLDQCSLNVHGLLYAHLDGLRDASISLKLGRVHIPVDHLMMCWIRYENCRNASHEQVGEAEPPDISLMDVMDELELPRRHEEKIMQTISDSKDFFSSILRGIREVQFAVSYIGLTKKLHAFKSSGSDVYLNMAMAEVGLDLHRLDPKSPAHRMYFSRDDISHEALFAAIGLSLDVDEGQRDPDRLAYIPMATTTIKTTLPSRTVKLDVNKGADSKNSNKLFANVVVTSPSVDLDPKHLPLVLALTRTKSTSHKPSHKGRYHLMSRLLPKANIKMSVHEPVIRVVLPPMESDTKDEDDYDLLISSNSSISLDLESSHSDGGDLRYSLVSNLRVTSHQFYYQTALGNRHDLLMTESLELKVQLNATPEVCVVATGNIKTFSVHMVRPELSEGIRQIVKHLRADGVKHEKIDKPIKALETNFLRTFPSWLTHFYLEGSDFHVDVAGIDSEISSKTRGVALQLESWTAEYQAQRTDTSSRRPSRWRAGSRTSHSEDAMLDSPPPSPSRKPQHVATDGRRLAVHVHGLEGFVIESLDRWEQEPFVSLPRFETAFTTTSDAHGQIFHINASARSIGFNYSLYRHYAIGVAGTVLQTAFVSTKADRDRRISTQQPMSYEPLSPRFLDDFDFQQSPAPPVELVTLDFRVAVVQVKASMPADPKLLLQIYSLDTGRHRWAPPFLKAKLIRLHAQAPKVKSAWTRLMSLKHARVDLRESKRKSNGILHAERSIDISTDMIRLAVPHQLVVHKIFDNFANVTKATKQLQHRFKTGTNEYILGKRAEGPRHVPRVTLRSRAVLFELEDGPFEWKLSTIYRVGLIEQKHRLAREEAFHVKTKRMEQMERRGPTNHHTRAAQSRRSSQNITQSDTGLRTKSNESKSANGTNVPVEAQQRNLRYHREGVCGLSDAARVSIDDAWRKLQEYNAQSWRKRIDLGLRFQRGTMKERNHTFWGTDDLPHGVEETETILAHSHRPALMAASLSDLNIVLDKPSFQLHECARFLNRIGKGMPMNMQYSLLIPMNLQVDMGEAKISLRDYPLPLVHVPPLRSDQSARLPSWSLKTDFVIAEELRDPESTKPVQVEVVPPDDPSSKDRTGGFAIEVKRTISPVKMYSDVNVDINTHDATKITWGTSYQPAIQDMMMIIETFTKPQVDPSDRIGFWDKIRLCIHSRVNLAWKGEGDVHLMLKGSRDPYVITGHGAGFVMCWRNDTRWRIGQEDDPRRFMTVDSGEYLLAIPDYSQQARHSTDLASHDAASILSSSSLKSGSLFKKVIMKLSGNVQWLVGLVFERDEDEGRRSFTFKPHYDVTLRSRDFAKPSGGKPYDALRGFRSNYIHLSMAVVAPLDRDWSVTNLNPSLCYNAVHLTPRFFTHFFDWWSLFSGVMSLPIRQGKLWPGVEKSTKKFGRHLATIKYSLLLSPLYMSHIYKHKDAEDYAEDVVSATGLKIRLDSFMLDLHQRREEFATRVKGRKRQTKTSGMRINEVQLDFISADIRAVSASIAGTTAEDLKRASEDVIASYNEPVQSVDMSRFTIPDNDFSWIDMDDFVELDWVLPAEANPKTKIMPLAYAPRCTYFRQTDHGNSVSGDTTRSSPFGNEPTHFCVMSRDNDPRQIQYNIIRERLATLNNQVKDHQRTVGEAQLDVIKDVSNSENLREKHETLKEHGYVLMKRKELLQKMLRTMNERPEKDLQSVVPDFEDEQQRDERPAHESRDGMNGVDAAPLADYASDFNNRFIIHNMQMKWNNPLRNIILRYIHQVGQRRGFVYYMTRRAVKFILDIVEEQNKTKKPQADSPTHTANTSASSTTSSAGDEESDSSVEDRIRQLLGDDNKSVKADDKRPDAPRAAPGGLNENLSPEYMPLNSYHVRLIAPQFQMQSERNPKSAVLVTAKGMQLKVVQIMDKDRVLDTVSGLVQRRFSAEMDSVQFFVTNQKTFAPQYLHIFAGNVYGTKANSLWPPWVPLEVIFEFQLSAYGFSRVVKKTSASLRYDKYNTLRLKYNDEVTAGESNQPQARESMESRIDHLWVDFPEIKAICDSSQWNAMYLIVLDLLLYSEPLEKIRSERLEKIMLASDFSDLRGAPEMVTRLQDRIRQLEEIKMQFQINAKDLGRQGWEDQLSIEKDLASCEDELFFMMKAITTAQRKYDDRHQTSGLLRWYLSASDVVWHLVREKHQPLMEFQLQNAAYDRTDNSDGSNHNSMHIEKIRGFNLLPDAIYPDMIGPYFGDNKSFGDGRETKMLRVYWYMLEAIAGIPVMDHFEVNLFPMKIQLEREIGKKLFEYMFPGMDSNALDGGSGLSELNTKRLQGGLDVDGSPEESEVPGFDAEHSEHKRHSAHEYDKSLEMRLKPTMSLPGNNASITAPTKMKHHGRASSEKERRHFRLFPAPERPRSRSRTRSIRNMSLQSSDSLTMTTLKANDRSTTSLASANSPAPSSDSSKRFGLRRSLTKDRADDKRSDDLTQMVSRASNYMTLAYVKIPSMVLCLSYKGRGERNIEDVNDFVFRMPMLEYRNKTWSSLDLALHLKRDVIKALISHTGAIIGNKFSHHRPKHHQQSRLREIANASSLFTGGDTSNHSDSSSLYGHSPVDERASSPRPSFGSEMPGSIPRNPSYASSIRSTAASRSLYEDAPSIAITDAGDDNNHGSIRNTLTRHLSNFGQRARSHEGTGEESDESNRKKSRILLGKKILGSLN
ncbi:MAG: hypothetical protein M1833_006855 [Piccolia ochrophora]|nr:MAG: hypothetical protein M1833_006855 [Piccolia ochrophora]